MKRVLYPESEAGMQLKPFHNRHLRRLASLKTGILLMAAVAVASMVGTALPYERSLRVVFYSGWFRLLLLFLAANLALCTYQTLTAKVLPSLRPRIPKSADFHEEGPMRFSFASRRLPEEVESVLFARGFRVSRENDYLCARKGVLGAFAIPLAHVGFVVVLIGGFASGFLAFHGAIRLNVGESTTTMTLPEGQASVRPLGFTVRCLDFQTATFPRTRIPSRFVTTLEITDGQKQFVGSVEVNKALQWRGLKFHQSSFGELPGQFRYRVSVSDSNASCTAEILTDVGQRVHLENLKHDLLLTASLAGTRYAVLDDDKVEASGFLGKDVSDYEITAERFVPDFMMDGNRQVVSRTQQMNNPALQVVWTGSGQPVTRQWLFLRPELRAFSHGNRDTTRLELERAEPDADGKMAFRLAAYDATANVLLGKFSVPLGGKVRLADWEGTTSQPVTGTTSIASRSPLPDPSLDTQNAKLPYAVRLLAKEPLFYTELSVSYNPAIPVIYFGAILTCLSICLALFMRRITLWVWCRNLDGRMSVVVDYARERTTLTAGVARMLEALKK